MRDARGWRWLLGVPAVLGYLASTEGWIAAKLGVPLFCAALLVIAHVRRLAGRWDLGCLIAALGWSAVGDWFLSHRAGRESFFLAGIGFFFCAHLGYLGFARFHGGPVRRPLAVLLLVFVPYYLLALWPAISSGVLAVAVFVYLLISCVALAAALAMQAGPALKRPYVAGIALIVFSDTLISFHEFLHYDAWNALILPTYYLAHLWVTWAALGPTSSTIEPW